MPRADRSKGGRPPYDHVLMFRILILQASHSLSDERTEYLIKDRLSFMRFLGLSLADRVPDANSIWLPRGADAGADRRRPGDRGAVPPLRGADLCGGLHRHGRADRRRDRGGGAEAAQHRGREAGAEGGPHPRSLGLEAPPNSPRKTVTRAGR